MEKRGWVWSGPRGVEMLDTGPLGGSPTHPHHLIHITMTMTMTINDNVRT